MPHGSRYPSQSLTTTGKPAAIASSGVRPNVSCTLSANEMNTSAASQIFSNNPGCEPSRKSRLHRRTENRGPPENSAGSPGWQTSQNAKCAGVGRFLAGFFQVRHTLAAGGLWRGNSAAPRTETPRLLRRFRVPIAIGHGPLIVRPGGKPIAVDPQRNDGSLQR